jgi:tetratricopeptide (TPR) repeat protein
VCLALGLTGAVAGCSPLYGGKPEKLKNPERKKRPAEVTDAAPEIKYVEECNANFSDDPKKARPQPTAARPLFDAAESALEQSDKVKEDSMKVSLLKEAIDKYRNALIKDPYNVPATLKLAVAYDRVLRKACAIAMLKRLASLSNNPKWTSEANRNIDAIDANAQWFKGYRKDAMAAVGR